MKMTNEQMLAAVLALPDVEMLTASKIDDPIGADRFYSARTVVALIAKERERCAKLCESLYPDANPNDCADEIRKA